MRLSAWVWVYVNLWMRSSAPKAKQKWPDAVAAVVESPNKMVLVAQLKCTVGFLRSFLRSFHCSASGRYFWLSHRMNGHGRAPVNGWRLVFAIGHTNSSHSGTKWFYVFRSEIEMPTAHAILIYRFECTLRRWFEMRNASVHSSHHRFRWNNNNETYSSTWARLACRFYWCRYKCTYIVAARPPTTGRCIVARKSIKCAIKTGDKSVRANMKRRRCLTASMLRVDDGDDDR